MPALSAGGLLAAALRSRYVEIHITGSEGAGRSDCARPTRQREQRRRCPGAEARSYSTRTVNQPRIVQPRTWQIDAPKSGSNRFGSQLRPARTLFFPRFPRCSPEASPIARTFPHMACGSGFRSSPAPPAISCSSRATAAYACSPARDNGRGRAPDRGGRCEHRAGLHDRRGGPARARRRRSGQGPRSPVGGSPTRRCRTSRPSAARPSPPCAAPSSGPPASARSRRSPRRSAHRRHRRAAARAGRGP